MTNDTGVEVWRGGVNVWECDEMGHMNVRFYVTRAMQGLVGLAAELGMPEAFSPTPIPPCWCASSTSASCARRARRRPCT